MFPPTELQAIREIYDLDRDEVEILMEMSRAFIEGVMIGADPLALSPMEKTNV